MLRLALVEELQRLADGVVAARRSREQARTLGGRSSRRRRRSRRAHRSAAATRKSKPTAGCRPPSSSSCCSGCATSRRRPAPAWQALQRALEAQGDSADELLRVEHQREAADQLAIGNVITSMRLLSSIDWPLFFERVSLVEQVLREDPAGAYAEMDFPTRDRYRHSVEELAKRLEAAGDWRSPQRVDRAGARGAASAIRDNDRRHHVGYYLISRGRFTLEQELRYPPSAARAAGPVRLQAPGARLPRHDRGRRRRSASPACSPTPAGTARRHGELWLVGARRADPGQRAGDQPAQSAAHVADPRRGSCRSWRCATAFPRSDRTMVVVPAIIDSEARVESLFDDLEVRFLATAIRTCTSRCSPTFPMRRQRPPPSDEALVRRRAAAVDELNARHGAGSLLPAFTASAAGTPSERRWMGWERKRGKLAEFNRLLRGATDTSFVVAARRPVDPAVDPLRHHARLRHAAADGSRRGAWSARSSHPLNRPRFDARLRRVTEGYGVLQPRVQRQRRERQPDAVRAGVLRTRRHRSVHDRGVRRLPGPVPRGQLRRQGHLRRRRVRGRARRPRAGEHAAQPRPVRGLLRARRPVHRHRAGRRLSRRTTSRSRARQHRWVRGDWQIARWLWRDRARRERPAVPNTLPAIARWKILDNLRRSLLPPALVALLVAGWTILPGSPLLWSTLALLVLAFPAYVQVGALALEPRAAACRCASTSSPSATTSSTSAAPGVPLDGLPAAPERA